jgi:ubiquinone/menaquinone biosynthesis C-methylase UbiE
MDDRGETISIVQAQSLDFRRWAMTSAQMNSVKQQVAAHWNRRADHFDEDFGHSIRTPAERAAWDRVLDLVLPARGVLEALDIGCGTGFLSVELASRGHRVTGIDFAPAMIAKAQKKAVERRLPVLFAEADAEQLPFAAAGFDVAVSRHLLWTLPHPDTAIDEWIRVLRPSGRLIIVESQVGVTASPEPLDHARQSPEYALIGDRLPYVGGWPRKEAEELFAAHRLLNIGTDPFLDLVTAEERRMTEEELERRTRLRYVVWGDVRP